jgi:hypothetical protein
VSRRERERKIGQDEQDEQDEQEVSEERIQ